MRKTVQRDYMKWCWVFSLEKTINYSGHTLFISELGDSTNIYNNAPREQKPKAGVLKKNEVEIGIKTISKTLSSIHYYYYSTHLQSLSNGRGLG